MKITYFQLGPHLTKSLASIYVISGDELLLKNDAIQQLRKKAKQEGFSERIRVIPEAGYDWNQLYTLLHSRSLLAEKRIIELDFRDTTPPKLASQILQEYSQQPFSDNLLLIDIAKVDDKISKSAWYKALEKNGTVVTIWPISREQLPEWLIKRAQKYKLQLTHNAANLLADYVEGNLVAAAQALEKIYLLKPTQAIDSELIHTLLTDESKFTVFDLVESFIASDSERALHILSTLQEEGIEPTLVLWALTREIRLLIKIAEQVKQGINYETIWQQQRIFSKRQPLIRQFLSKSSLTDCLSLLSTASQIDKIIKGAAPGNAWNALQLLCLRTATENRN